MLERMKGMSKDWRATPPFQTFGISGQGIGSDHTFTPAAELLKDEGWDLAGIRSTCSER
jgi:hypothetical protein